MNEKTLNSEAPLQEREERERAAKRHLDEKLDAALAETFPASDPVEIASKPD